MNNSVVSTFVLIVALAIFFLYVSPTWSGPIAATNAAIAADDQALVAATQYFAQESSLTDASNAIDPNDLSRLTVFLPDSVDNVGLILDLTTLAAKNGLSLSNIDVASSPASGGPAAAGTNPVGSVDMSLSAIGTYAALQNFLIAVEKSERLLDMQKLSIAGSDTGVYSYGMTLRIYWLH